MIKPDLIMIWPRAFDFPLIREFIVRNRRRFKQVIISFTHNSVERDYRDFLKQNHPDFTFVDSVKNVNWYDDAVNEAIDAVKSEWVLFMEQDFTCTDQFLKDLLTTGELYQYLAYEEGRRLHLCCTLLKLSTINRTPRYFGISARYSLDCFDLFMAQVEVIHRELGSTLEKAGLIKIDEKGQKNCNHLNGLVHNYNLVCIGQPDAVVGKEAFKNYNELSLKAKVIQEPTWKEIMLKVKKI